MVLSVNGVKHEISVDPDVELLTAAGQLLVIVAQKTTGVSAVAAFQTNPLPIRSSLLYKEPLVESELTRYAINETGLWDVVVAVG